MDTTHFYIEGVPFRTGSLPARELDGSSLDAVVAQAPSRWRTRIGRIRIEVRDFHQNRIHPLKVTPATVMLLAVRQGRCRLLSDDGAADLLPGNAMLVAGGKQILTEWQAQSRGLYVSMQRVHLQAVASAIFHEPRRLAALNLLLSHESMPELFRSMERLGELAMSGVSEAPQRGECFGEVLLSDVIHSIAAADSQVEILPVARSVKCAIDFIAAQSGRNCSPARLAGAAGVTQATLIKSFKACLGTSIKSYVTDIRLNAAYACLSSGNDGRPVSEIALSADFGHVSGFSRLYQKRFRETPSQTRARAVRS